MGGIGTGHPGFQFLDLISGKMEPAISSQAGQISEDWLVDPTHVDPATHKPQPLLLSPGEGLYCNPAPQGVCDPNYEIAQITYPVGGPSTLQFYENDLSKTVPTGGVPDSAAEDCSAEIALASVEFEAGQLSAPFIADLTQLTYPTIKTWTAPSQFFALLGSYLSPSGHTAAGPIAVAQGGSHEGVLGQESAGDAPVANTITAFRINYPYSTTKPFADWVTCNLGNDPTGSVFWQGADPHTVTAYQSPTQDIYDGNYHSFAVLADRAPATYLAVVDLDRMLSQPPQKVYVHRDPLNPNVCVGGLPGTAGTLPSTVVRFVQVR